MSIKVENINDRHRFAIKMVLFLINTMKKVRDTSEIPVIKVLNYCEKQMGLVFLLTYAKAKRVVHVKVLYIYHRFQFY